MPEKKSIIALSGPVTIEAAKADGESKGPAKFSVVAYTGGAIRIRGWDYPVVVDIAGMDRGNSLVANLDHQSTQRVGNVTDMVKTTDTLVLSGTASAVNQHSTEVTASAANGFVFQASIEADPDVYSEIAAGKKFTANGKEFTGPAYLVTKSTLKGFAFVSHGADDNTLVTIAASADDKQTPEKSEMEPKLKSWIEAMGFEPDKLDATQLAGLTANFNGQPAKKVVPEITAGFEGLKAERQRVEQITAYALDKCEDQPRNIDAIKKLAEQAIDAKWPLDKFRLELLEATVPQGSSPWARVEGNQLSNRVLEAAVCMVGRLPNLEKVFDDQTLQAAHDQFPQGIALNQLILLGAQAAGFRTGHSSKVTVEAQRAAFGMSTPTQIRAAGFSTISIPNILSNVANKFLRMGWDMVDMTPLRIAGIRNVTDFKTITTVSLCGDTEFRKVGAGGEIEHGDLGEVAYSNKADTYARMLAITRTDYINDDLGALTWVPKKLGRGGGLMLNKIFWTKFLNNSAFFTSGRTNVNTAVADMSSGGLAATETIFLAQTDPDSQPLGVSPEILLVPTALKSPAKSLMDSEKVKGSTDGGDANIWKDRFRVESSPYMSNAAYTGYSAAAWYMLADPNEMPVIEIVALNGRVEPVVETADADFNVLGVQMRGYSDVGVEMQEYRGGVRADGGSS